RPGDAAEHHRAGDRRRPERCSQLSGFRSRFLTTHWIAEAWPHGTATIAALAVVLCDFLGALAVGGRAAGVRQRCERHAWRRRLYARTGLSSGRHVREPLWVRGVVLERVEGPSTAPILERRQVRRRGAGRVDQQ